MSGLNILFEKISKSNGNFLKGEKYFCYSFYITSLKIKGCEIISEFCVLFNTHFSFRHSQHGPSSPRNLFYREVHQMEKLNRCPSASFLWSLIPLAALPAPKTTYVTLLHRWGRKQTNKKENKVQNRKKCIKEEYKTKWSHSIRDKHCVIFTMAWN